MKVYSSGKNDFVPFLGLMVYCTLSLMGILGRILSIIAYFAPSLGLFNFLTHLTYENMSKDRGIVWKENGEGNIPLRFSTFDEDDEQYHTLYLSNITSRLLTNADYSKYTGMPLQMYYIIFLVGVFLHLGIVFSCNVMMKRRFDQHDRVMTILNKLKFRKCISPETIRNFEKLKYWNWFVPFIHSMVSFGFPQTSLDWDEVEKYDSVTKAKHILKVLL